MIFVQHLPGVGDVQIVFRADAPGETGHPVEVSLDDRVFSGSRRHLFHAAQLTQRLFLRFLRHTRLGDLLAILIELDRLLVLLAQLALDSLELLAQEILALHFLHLGLGIGPDLLAQLHHLQLAAEDAHELADLVFHVIQLQDFLGILHRQAHVAGNLVDQLARVVHAQRRHSHVLRHVGQEFHQATE